MDHGIFESKGGIPNKLGKLPADDSLALLLFKYTNLKDINTSAKRQCQILLHQSEVADGYLEDVRLRILEMMDQKKHIGIEEI